MNSVDCLSCSCRLTLQMVQIVSKVSIDVKTSEGYVASVDGLYRRFEGCGRAPSHYNNIRIIATQDPKVWEEPPCSVLPWGTWELALDRSRKLLIFRLDPKEESLK